MVLHEYLILLGCNLGDCTSTFDNVRESVSKACPSYEFSKIYRTEAWGLESQPDFLNQAIRIAAPWAPQELLEWISTIESSHERERAIRWGPRTLDIDILLWKQGMIHSPTLKIPHPRMHQRAFALIPAMEVAPHWLHQRFGVTVTELAKLCKDTLNVVPVFD